MKLSEQIRLMESHLNSLRRIQSAHGDRDIVGQYSLRLDLIGGGIWANAVGVSMVGGFGSRYLPADADFAEFVTGGNE